ncbi:hypothetical protein DV515_00012025 [Chloebia gouldiae]|uniref:Uncharacterized protein n=1 Tax=Chloebia gouldiae TaxID=44316 RepID=A0A3L8S5Y1_CHLGU|nr:hypothetical protein DV515_00012025 [Chloebia gouldiae]
MEDAGKYPDCLEHFFILSFFPKEKPPGAARQEDALSFAEQWFRGFQGCLPGWEWIMPKGDLGSATSWIKRFVGMLNLAAAFHPN